MIYRVYAKMKTGLHIDIEAESEEEAMEIADETDGGDFIESPFDCSWEITHAVPITDIIVAEDNKDRS